MGLPFLLNLYQKLTPFVEKGVVAYLHRRMRRGKEDPNRLKERFGVASIPRPAGSIAWFHGASVGEAVSLLPVLHQIRREFPHVTPLITTGTVTAATVIGKSLPQGCIHQYSPVDIPAWIENFLSYWQPDIAVFVESEFWPNLILRCKARGIPLYLVSATLSKKSYQSWKRFPAVIDYLLSCFELILAQSGEIANRLKDLGADPSKLKVCGNLKFAATALACDLEELQQLQSTLSRRPLWVAASTHVGEEGIVADAHKTVKKTLQNLLTVLIPRHPHRGLEIKEELVNKGLKVARRSNHERIEPSTDIYLVDTIGELGLFYRLSEVAFIGGTFVPIGGHNPIEAVLLSCALLWGPYTHKQTEICDVLGPAACPVVTKEELAATLKQLLEEKDWREEKIILSQNLLKEQAHILNYVIDALRHKLQFKDGLQV
jgi:3-deoxy-D-manno-octulosonic-acid transferase